MPLTLPASKSQHNRIRSVTIEGFRSLRHIQKLELPQLTLLIGANGAGKSTLIRFFEMLSWMLKAKSLQEFVVRYGGAMTSSSWARAAPRAFVQSWNWRRVQA